MNDVTLWTSIVPISHITKLQITHTLKNHTYKLILVVQNILFLHASQLMDYSHPVITKIYAILQILRIALMIQCYRKWISISLS